MALSTNRPDGIPFHAAAGAPVGNITPVRESLYRLTGYVDGQIIESDEHNGKFQSAGFWLSYMDCGMVYSSDWLNLTNERQLNPDALEYEIGVDATASPGAAVTSRTSFLIRGVRVETDSAFLQTVSSGNWAGDPLYVGDAPKPGRIWIYAVVPTGPGTGVRVEGVAAGVADSAVGNEVAIAGVDIDIAGLVTGNVAPITVPLVRSLDVVIPVTLAAVTVASLVVTGTATVQGLTTLQAGLDVTGLAHALGGLQVDGNTTLGLTNGETLTVNATTTIVAGTPFNALGNVTLGTAPLGTLTVNASATFNLGAVFDETTTVNVGKAFRAFGACTLGTSAADTITCDGIAVFNEAVTCNELVTFDKAGPALASNASAVMDWSGHATFSKRLSVTATESSAAGDYTKDGNDNAVYRNAAGDREIHVNVGGWVSGYGQSDNIGPIQVAQLDTAVAVAPIVAATLDIFATALIQFTGGGDVTVALFDVTGGPAQIGANRIITVPATGTNNYFSLAFPKAFAADTTARVYRLEVDAGFGNTCLLKDARIKVVPAL